MSLLAVPDTSGAAVLYFFPESSDDRRIVDEAVKNAKKNEHDGPYALSKFLLDIADRREFTFNVGSSE